MADVSQVKINNVTYNIKDTTARTTANEKVSKSGDTMSGDLYIQKSSFPRLFTKNTTYTNGTDTPATNQWVGGVEFKDKNDISFGYVDAQLQSDGTSNIRLLARSYNGGNIDNNLILYSAPDGTRTVTVTHPAAWRSAIGAVNIDGDTMTGSLTISKDASSLGFWVKDNRWELGDTVASAMWAGIHGMKDASGNNVGIIQSCYDTNKKSYLQFTCRNKVGGSNVDHILALTVAADGTKNVNLDTTASEAWRKALKVNDSGWQSLTNSAYFTGTIYYRKVSGMVTVNFPEIKLVNARDNSDWTTIGTLPSGYRPDKNGNCQVVMVRGSNQVLLIYIYTSGEIKISAPYGNTFPANVAIYTNIIYPVGF